MSRNKRPSIDDWMTPEEKQEYQQRLAKFTLSKVEKDTTENDLREIYSIVRSKFPDDKDYEMVMELSMNMKEVTFQYGMMTGQVRHEAITFTKKVIAAAEALIEFEKRSIRDYQSVDDEAKKIKEEIRERRKSK